MNKRIKKKKAKQSLEILQTLGDHDEPYKHIFTRHGWFVWNDYLKCYEPLIKPIQSAQYLT